MYQYLDGKQFFSRKPSYGKKVMDTQAHSQKFLRAGEVSTN